VRPVPASRGPRKAPKTIRCAGCGLQRRNAGGGLCNRCKLADPDRPFRYAGALAQRTGAIPPSWWDELAAFAAARHHPGGAISVLRATGRLLVAEPSASPQRLLECCARDRPTNRALGAFFTTRGLALPGDDEQRRGATRRRRTSTASPQRSPPPSTTSVDTSSTSANGPVHRAAARSLTAPSRRSCGSFAISLSI